MTKSNQTIELLAFTFEAGLREETELRCAYCPFKAGYNIQKTAIPDGDLSVVSVIEQDVVCDLHLEQHYGGLDVAGEQHKEPTIENSSRGPIK